MYPLDGEIFQSGTCGGLVPQCVVCGNVTERRQYKPHVATFPLSTSSTFLRQVSTSQHDEIAHDSLEQVLPTLFLWGEASHGPDLDLDASVELLPSHVPHALVRRGHRFILRRESLLS